MSYSETQTAIMQVMDSINNRLIPVHLPHEYESFLTSEVVNGIIEAMNYNDDYKLIDGFDITPLGYFEGFEIDSKITYYPFDVPSELELSSIQLPIDFVFTLDNTDMYSWIFGSVTMSRKLLDIERLNRSHRYLHSLGFEPYAMNNRDGINKFNGLFYTKHDYFPSATSSNWAKSNYPINPKVALIDDNPNDKNLRAHFGFPPRPADAIGGELFKIGSLKNLDNVIHSTIKFFRAVSHDGLVIKPGSDGVILPYYNKTLYYANPHYGYYDNYYEVKTFYGGSYDSVTNQPLISGTAYACGFKVVWFTDTEFWITLKYKLVYRDNRPIVYDPSLCCLAQCFGITE